MIKFYEKNATAWAGRWTGVLCNPEVEIDDKVREVIELFVKDLV